MEEKRKLHTLTQVHKLKKGIAPEYLLNKLTSRDEILTILGVKMILILLVQRKTLTKKKFSINP